MSDSWYKVDNVAKVFLATASMRDPRVFRISCTLQEQVDPDTLNEALRRSGKDLRWVEKKAAAQKLKIDEVYLMVACPDGSCDIVAKERGR